SQTISASGLVGRNFGIIIPGTWKSLQERLTSAVQWCLLGFGRGGIDACPGPAMCLKVNAAVSWRLSNSPAAEGTIPPAAIHLQQMEMGSLVDSYQKSLKPAGR